MENEQIQTEEQIDYSSIDQQKDVETASRSLKAMSHPLRLMILCKLGEDEFSVQDIVDNVGTLSRYKFPLILTYIIFISYNDKNAQTKKN